MYAGSQNRRSGWGLMPSTLTWLDASAEDQRRMREIVGLFSTTDSRDELGIGQIRDTLSDTLFPGTSVLITRARYLLFVPWCFQKAAEASRPGADGRRDRYERDLIETLRKEPSRDGLIGVDAGRALKTLPSATYWNSIRRWQVLSDPSVTWQDALEAGRIQEGGDEPDQHAYSSSWDSGLPKPPAGFPTQAPGGFDLTAEEARWLAGRIVTSCDGTLLAHLVEHRPQPDSAYPWSDPAAMAASPGVRTAVEHAQVFSLAVHGAALLYNLLLAEQYVAEGFDRLGDRTDQYRESLSAWAARRDATHGLLDRWTFDEFRGFIGERNAAVSPRTWAFLRSWCELALPLGAEITDSPVARQFIAGREREHKRSQSRLRNRGLLGAWSGAAGSGAIAFRWGAVRRILLDVHDGLERTDA